jgi:hypothetical protein
VLPSEPRKKFVLSRHSYYMFYSSASSFSMTGGSYKSFAL